MSRGKLLKRCVEDMLAFGRICMPRTFDLPPCPMHLDIRDVLQDNTRQNVNILAPRGHAKTTVAGSAGSLWHMFCEDLLYGKPQGEKFVLLISKSRGHAVDILTSIKNTLEYSQEFQSIFGYHGSHNSRIWTRDEIALDNGCIVTCRGSGQQVRGLNKGGLRPSYICVDDPEDEENTKTDERMEQTLRWFLQAVLPAGAPGTKNLVIGTPQHHRSLVMVLKDMPSWQTLHYKALDSDDDGNEVALWPERRPVEWLEEKREELSGIGRSSVFAREYQCEIIGDEDQLFREEWLKEWDGEVLWDSNKDPYLRITHLKGEQLNVPRRVPVTLFAGIDPAASTKNTADYTVIFTVALDQDKNVYCIECFRKRMQATELVDAIISQYKTYKWNKCQLESNLYRGLLKPYIMSVDQYIPGMAINNVLAVQKKAERIEGLQPFFARGMVYLRPGMQAFKDELLMFPRGKHDDTLDAFYWARKGAYIPFHEIVEGDSDRQTQEKAVYYDWMVE